jgi:sulfate adenylyltransferase
MALVSPHGGKLVNRILESTAAAAAKREAESLLPITLSPREAGDLEMLAIGAFSPLEGFMGRADFERVCREMRLANGTVWPIPVVLAPPDDTSAKVQPGQRVALKDDRGRLLALMTMLKRYNERGLAAD